MHAPGYPSHWGQHHFPCTPLQMCDSACLLPAPLATLLGPAVLSALCCGCRPAQAVSAPEPADQRGGGEPGPAQRPAQLDGAGAARQQDHPGARPPPRSCFASLAVPYLGLVVQTPGRPPLVSPRVLSLLSCCPARPAASSDALPCARGAAARPAALHLAGHPRRLLQPGRLTPSRPPAPLFESSSSSPVDYLRPPFSLCPVCRPASSARLCPAV
jgi:hypothetical protein